MDERRLRDFLKSKIDAGVFSGCSVIFGRPNAKLIEIYEGTAGKDIKDRIQPDTIFDLQSITKTVSTSALFLRLLQDGRIHLNGPVGQFLTDLEIETDSHLHSITFRHLLTHSSGISDASLDGEFGSRKELWQHMLNAKPVFQPGTGIEYTDLGYRILGKALEQIIGKNIDTASKELIWRPLGMNMTTFNPTPDDRIAATPDSHGAIDDEQVRFLGGALGCDGVFSSANDLFKFMSALLEEKSVISEKTLKTTTANTIGFETNPSNFFESLAIGPKNIGWEVNPSGISYAGKFQKNNTCIEKAGGAGTFIWLDPTSEYIFVYLTNYGKPKPFDENSWNRLIADVGPHQVSDIIYESL